LKNDVLGFSVSEAHLEIAIASLDVTLLSLERLDFLAFALAG